MSTSPRKCEKSKKSGHPTARSRAWRQQRGRNLPSSAVTQRQLHGGRIPVPENPPDVNYQPWVKVTLVHSCTSSWAPQAFDLIGVLRKQLDPTKRGFNQITDKDSERKFVVQFKIYSVRAWNLTGKVIALSADDFSQTKSAIGDREQLCGIVDTGGASHTPSVGYLYPANQRQTIVRTDDVTGSEYIFNVTAGSNDQLIIYIDLSYRFDGPSKPPTLILPFDRFTTLQDANNKQTNNVVRILRKLDSMQTELVNIAKYAKQSAPSTINKVVNGVTTAAMLVAPFLEEDSEASSSSFDKLESLREQLDEIVEEVKYGMGGADA